MCLPGYVKTHSKTPLRENDMSKNPEARVLLKEKALRGAALPGTLKGYVYLEEGNLVPAQGFHWRYPEGSLVPAQGLHRRYPESSLVPA